MQLENFDHSIHWEKTILNDEIMNSDYLSGKGIFSKFTAAALLDTGWYI